LYSSFFYYGEAVTHFIISIFIIIVVMIITIILSACKPDKSQVDDPTKWIIIISTIINITGSCHFRFRCYICKWQRT